VAVGGEDGTVEKKGSLAWGGEAGVIKGHRRKRPV